MDTLSANNSRDVNSGNNTKKTAIQAFLGVEDENKNHTASKKQKNSRVSNTMMESFFSVSPISVNYSSNDKSSHMTKPNLSTFTPAATNFGNLNELSKPIITQPGEDREIRVARYGKVYKRKAPSKLGYLTKPTCAPGYRYCRMCDATLPLSAFYTTVKRYVCRRHHYLRVRGNLRKRVQANAVEQHANLAWYLISTSRFNLGYDKIRYDAADIRDLIINGKIPLDISPTVVPIDPSIPMRPRNVAIISTKAFKYLMDLYSFSCSRGMFIAFVQRCNLLPKNFDAAHPDDPYRDPQYMRQDHDVGPIINEEMKSKIETQDLSIIEESEKNDDVPWLTAEPLAANEGTMYKSW